METEEVEGQLAQLAQQLNCMGTEDEETLVKSFQQLLAPHGDLSPDLCRFFLDMNNWNLQEALGSFYDYNAQQVVFQSLPSMQFMADVTVGEGESIPTNTRFIKTWRIRNSGSEPWAFGCCLRHIEGDLLAETDHVNVETLKPEETTDVSLAMTSPATQGTYQSRWRMFTGAGMPFGETIWCIIVVDDSGLMDLTQRMASTSCGVDQMPPPMWMQHAAANADEPKGATLPFRNPFQSGIRHDYSQQQAQSGFGPENHKKPFEFASGSHAVKSTSLCEPSCPPQSPAQTTSSDEMPSLNFAFKQRPLIPTESSRMAVDSAGNSIAHESASSSLDVEASRKNTNTHNAEALSTMVNIGAVSVIQPLQPLYGASSSDDDMEN